ncbi:hypothetical protein MA16_Dca002073 [Dendrobium catenatum]|uniref:Uncharacterized protein n=1 Tax=Dendrobium catenatum TaxID=906689 RepID=A0A2I0XEA7_9ASPA|nr:hypothetical protein MA16_Dca002073 [Dendrobium catenatum]
MSTWGHAGGRPLCLPNYISFFNKISGRDAGDVGIYDTVVERSGSDELVIAGTFIAPIAFAIPFGGRRGHSLIIERRVVIIDSGIDYGNDLAGAH